MILSDGCCGRDGLSDPRIHGIITKSWDEMDKSRKVLDEETSELGPKGWESVMQVSNCGRRGRYRGEGELLSSSWVAQPSWL